MTTHTLSLDEQTDLNDRAFQAYCSCGWAGRWHHKDEHLSADDAETAAIEEGTDHLAYL